MLCLVYIALNLHFSLIVYFPPHLHVFSEINFLFLIIFFQFTLKGLFLLDIVEISIFDFLL